MPVPTMAMRQRPMMAVRTNRSATKAAKIEMIARAGMTALSSAYDAPMRRPLLDCESVEYWSRKMLTAWMAM